jgi:hypothetical protein
MVPPVVKSMLKMIYYLLLKFDFLPIFIAFWSANYWYIHSNTSANFHRLSPELSLYRASAVASHVCTFGRLLASYATKTFYQ